MTSFYRNVESEEIYLVVEKSIEQACTGRTGIMAINRICGEKKALLKLPSCFNVTNLLLCGRPLQELMSFPTSNRITTIKFKR
jgi:hypothetical protein